MPFPSINVSSIGNHGGYGFFNSHRSETIDPQSGETVLTYDRCYTNEDMNAFMRGLVGSSGLFNQTGEILSTTSTANRQYTACRVKVNSTWTQDEANYKLQEAVDEYPAGTYFANVLPGKGLVNYHWFQIHEGDMVSVYFENSGDLEDRADKVSVRWDQDTRNVKIVVEKGNWNANLKTGSDISTTAKVNAVGMIQNRSWEDGVGLKIKVDPVTNHTMLEITLGYMYVHGTKWQTAHPRTCPLWFRDLRGGQYCPWITHLVAGPSAKDLDEKIRQYTDVIEEWIGNVQAGGDLGMKLSTIKLHINGDGTVGSSSFNLTTLAQQAGYDYTYSPDHTVMIYYNGLNMSAENGEFILNDNGNVTINNGTATQYDRGFIPENNMVDVVIFVGSTLAIPNGDFILY